MCIRDRSMAKTDALEELPSVFGGIGGCAACVGQCGNEYIFQHGTLGQQMVRLKNEANLLVANRCEFWLGEVREFFPIQLDATASGGVERAEDVKQGAFAAAGRADDRKGIGTTDSERDSVQYRHGFAIRAFVLLVHVLQPENDRVI